MTVVEEVVNFIGRIEIWPSALAPVRRASRDENHYRVRRDKYWQFNNNS